MSRPTVGLRRAVRAALLAAAVAAPAAAAAQSARPVDFARPAARAADSTAAPADSAVVDSAVAALGVGREAFSYGGQGRRDPFASLLKAGGDLRPLLTDLRLVAVLVGSDGRNSVAIMRDLVSKEQYRRHAGESLGRMRIARIEPRQVVFTIEEFGYSRQEVLTYGDSTTLRTR
jgi:hypothetical protein